MLAPLGPWRNLGRDLERPGQTWEKTPDDFLGDASWREKRVILSLQYFHECAFAAAAAANDSVNSTFARQIPQGEGSHPEDEDSSPPGEGLSEEGLADLKISAVPHRKELHVLLAIEAARGVKVFDDSVSWLSTATPRNAADDDLRRTSSWASQLQADAGRQNARTIPPPTQPTQTPSEPLSDYGSSVHSKGSAKDEARKELQEFWRDVRCLIIDELFMISGTFLVTLSRDIVGLEGPPIRMRVIRLGGRNGQRLLVFRAENAIKDRPHLSLRERYALAERNTRGGQRKHKDLPETIELAIRVSDGEEPPLDDTSIIELKRLPQSVLVKLNRTRATHPDALSNDMISMQIVLETKAETATSYAYRSI